MITRISIVELKKGEGILRESLDSLYSIFNTTREILRKYGPDVAKRTKKNEYSFGQLAIIILNLVLRPVLTKWHPLLQEYESKRDNHTSIKEHEDKWEYNMALRKDLENVRRILINYANHLAMVSNVNPLVFTPKRKNMMTKRK